MASAAFVVMSSLIKERTIKKRNRRRWWMTKLYQNRLSDRGPAFIQSLIENAEDGHFRNMVRMSAADFMFLLESIREKISRKDTHLRCAVSAEERLALTLRFLATGDSYTSMKYVFNISKQATSEIIPDVCKAIIETLSHHVQMPSSPEEWMEIASAFNEVWNFPNCLGALDRKHVNLQAPIQSGSTFYNYKSFFSIVLMALVDANYNFIFVDIGGQGGISDGGIFRNCHLYKNLMAKKLNLPMPKTLPGMTTEVPFIFLGDQAFALNANVMKPYSGLNPKGSPECIFNYRLSRALRVSENAFGILSAVFRVLRKPLLLEPEKAELVVMEIICLHNFLRRSRTSRNMYTPRGTFDMEYEDGEVINGTWRTEIATSSKGSTTSSTTRPGMEDLKKVARKPTKDGEQIRDTFAKYFISHGAVPR